MKNADRRLKLLLSIGETPERLSLAGGHCKRKAKLMKTARERNKALAAAAQHYERAAKLHRDATGRTDYYPALNAVLLAWLANARSNQTVRQKWDEALEDSQKAAAAEYALSPNFWNRVTSADIPLLRALLDDQLVQQRTEVRNAYRQAFREIGSAKDHASVISQLDFTISMLVPRKSKAKTVDALKSLRDELRKTIFEAA
jgi:hypothetical protein